MPSGVILLVIAVYVWAFWKFTHQPETAEEEEEETDFEFLTVREQIAAAKETADSLGDMEQLLTDMQLCSEDDVLVLHLEWVGRDNEHHAYDLYCNGSDTATECVAEIAAREAHDIRGTLAYQCSTLANNARSRKNSRKNDGETIGEDELAEVVSALWDDDFH
jgi:hypothetical protein